MTRPNLFSLATKELSQDAFLAWLMQWAAPECRTDNPALCDIAADFVRHLIGLQGEPPTSISTVKAGRQWENIDVWAEINDSHLIIIEDKVGTKLFERSKHHVQITPAGTSFVNTARKIIDLLESGALAARETADGLGGSLTIGFGGSMVYSLIPALVRQFRSAVPNVAIDFCTIPITGQLEALREGRLDIGVIRMPINDAMIAHHIIHTEPLIIALPNNHPLARNSEEVNIGELEYCSFISYETRMGYNFHTDLLELCRTVDFSPMIAHVAPNTEGVIGIVACGEGVAIVPASARHLSIDGATFRNLKVPRKAQKLSSVRFALAWNRESTSATARQFLSLFGVELA